MNNISFIIFTKNEEKRIAHVIKNFIAYGRVFILDGGSTDKTKEIAESMGASFYTRPESKSANVETLENFALKSHVPFLFHKDFVDFSNNHIHGIGRFIGSSEQKLTLPSTPEYALRHFSTYNTNKFTIGYLRYAEAESLEKYKAGEKFSVIKLFAAMIRYCWIYGRYCYKLGKLGLIIVMQNAFSRLMTYSMLYELEHEITLEKIEKTYSKEKEKILADF